MSIRLVEDVHVKLGGSYGEGIYDYTGGPVARLVLHVIRVYSVARGVVKVVCRWPAPQGSKRPG